MKHVIETLDLEDFLSPPESSAQQVFLNTLKHALETKGFFFLKNHRIKQRYIGAARRQFLEFFSLPEETRLQYEYAKEKHQRGYTPLRIETGQFATIPDEKHFFQVGIDRSVYVEELPDLHKNAERLFLAFQSQARILLEAVAITLGLERTHFSSKEGNSVMRAIDYPPTEHPLADDGIAQRGGNASGMCASKHTDINMLTLLEAKEEGLQLWDEDLKKWLPVTIHDPTLIIVNAGDMLEHVTGGRYVSGIHRVVCKRNVRRFSIPFFCHLCEDESIVPLAHLGEYDKGKYCHQTAGAFLDHRLKTIGL